MNNLTSIVLRGNTDGTGSWLIDDFTWNPVPTTTTTATGSTTTTVAGGGSSTTTTTVDGASTTTTTAKKCLFSRASDDGQKVQSLRELRNAKLNTALGAIIVGMYYKNMAEIADIFKNDDELNARFRLITRDTMPAVQALVLHGGATISADSLMQTHAFLTDLQAKANLRLRHDIDFILRGLESGWLLPWLGITVELE